MPRLLVATTLALLGTCSTFAADPQGSSVASVPPLIDLDGAKHDLRQNEASRARAFVFLSTECPISNGYTQTLNRLHEALGERDCELFAVVSDATLTRADARKHFEEFDADFTVLFDASGKLAAALEPTRVPEAFLLDPKRHLVYRGLIDDRWGDVGRGRGEAQTHHLRDAIDAVLAGKSPAQARTKPIGCLFEQPVDGAAEGAVTFNRDIAPIVYSRCVSCHRKGQVAPFPLTSYEHVAKRADWIVEVTKDRIMPPWSPHPGEHRFVEERWLTDDELSLLERWAKSGRPRGDAADLPPLPKFAEGWRLGEPDLVLRMPEPFTVHAEGLDIFRNFVIPIDIPEDKLVSAVEFHPGNKRVVHHSVLFLDSNGAARKLDEADEGPGYGLFGGPGILPTGALGGWSVGNTPRHLPNGMGRYLKKGSDLVMQIHYHPNGREETDQSEVGVYFTKKPVAETLKEPAKLVGSIWLANYEMDIPAGESAYRRSSTYTLPKPVKMVGVVPHMHLLGKSMKATAEIPASEDEPARTTTLVDVRNWNYNWQDEYYFERPFELPAGTKLRVEAVYDNSADNPSNPSSPPKRVTWGDETDDEMFFCFFLLTSNRTEDLVHVVFDNLRADFERPRATVDGDTAE